MSMQAVNAYAKLGRATDATGADPHRLIQMLIDGALEKMVIARALMERGDVARKCEHITWALSIIGGLQTSLDRDRGGELAHNLGAIYEFIGLRLVQANANNDAEILSECIQLIRTIKEGWDGIRPEALELVKRQAQAQPA